MIRRSFAPSVSEDRSRQSGPDWSLDGEHLPSHSHSLEGNAQGTTSSRKVAISSGIGATIEAYDFIGYGTAAALYFSTDFFPSGDPLTGTLLSFATLGVGFAVRPLGGVIGGYLGDKIGRKPVLVASLILMGLATFFIGLLPTYATVGIWAGILLVLVRVIQGLAYGAEWGGAILMTYEHAPWRNQGQIHRHRAGRLPRRTAAGQPGLPGLASTCPAPGPGACRSCCPSSWSSSA